MVSLVLAALVVAFFASPASAAFWSSNAAQLDKLAPLIELKSGSIVAEIGAGNGAVTIAAAERVGPTGHVFSTEIGSEAVDEIKNAAAKAGLANVTVVQATASDTGLPVACCDAVFMIGVYHHFTDPIPTDASIFRALRPGGRLVIQDFRPAWWLKPWTPKGIPSNRGGHGIPEPILEGEVTGAGFRIVHAYDHWGDSWMLNNYCVVFQKPADASSAASR
ncbi:MAG: class I SAM-dependent methyltransferase [Candidatus Binataceae bacterium]